MCACAGAIMAHDRCEWALYVLCASWNAHHHSSKLAHSNEPSTLLHHTRTWFTSPSPSSCSPHLKRSPCLMKGAAFITAMPPQQQCTGMGRPASNRLRLGRWWMKGACELKGVPSTSL